MKKLEYSIIYGVIRPEISERLSVGLVIVNGDTVKVRYSKKKLEVFKLLLSSAEYEFMSKVLHSLSQNGRITSENINYLSRYSNNLIALSPLQVIDLEPSASNEDWLYRQYVSVSYKTQA